MEGTKLQLETDKQFFKEHLTTLNKFRSPGPDERHPRLLKELTEELSEQLSIIFLKSWEMGEVPEGEGIGGGLMLSLSSKRATRRNLGTMDWLA